MKHRCEIFLRKLFKSAVFFVWALSIFFFAVMFSVFGFISLKAEAAPGVPNVISYQGRLTDSGDNLLGGTGTKFFFKFSIWDASDIATGTRLWPSSSPGTASTTVKEGVFTIDIGDPADTPDLLTFNFKDNDTVYLQVEVSSTEAGTFETLSPRQRITSSGYAINASTVLGDGQSAIGTTTPVSAATLTVEATSTSVIPLVVRGFLGQVADLFRIITSAGTQLFTFTSGGFFGIGTSTPSEALSVEGNAFISGNLTATGTTRFNDNTYTWPATIVEGNFLRTDASGNLTWAVAGGGGGGAGNWVFVDSQGGYIRLATTTNRVGIGTTTPYAKLSVNSGAAATTTFALRPVSGQTANIIDIYDTSGALTSVYTSGDFFGIGTTSPAEQLSVANLLYVGGTGTSTFTGGIRADILDIISSTATSTFANGIQIAAGCFELADGTCAGAGGGSSEFTDGGNFLRPNEADDSLLLGSSDFAGINALLALRATSSGSTIIFASSTVSGGDFVQFVDSTGTEQFAIDVNGLITSVGTGTSTFAGGLTVATSGGFVGIGTTSPQVLLEISENIPTLRLTSDDIAVGPAQVIGNIEFFSFDGNSEDVMGRIRSKFIAGDFGTQAEMLFSVYDSGTFRDAMIIANTGNIGIGTTSPYAKLSVVGEVVAEFFTATSTTATSTFTGLSASFLSSSGGLEVTGGDVTLPSNTIQGSEIDADTIGGTELADVINLDANFSIEGADIHSITLGGAIGASITSLTVDTDGTGDGEVVLPAQSIGAAEILNDTIDGAQLADTIVLDANLVIDGGATRSISLGVSGSSDITSLTVGTDGTGDGEVVLPDQSISGTEILNNTLDFIDFQDALDLDAATTLTFGANNFIYTLDSTGQFAIGTTSPEATTVFTLEATSTASIPLTIRAFSGQTTGNLLSIVDVVGNNIASIDASGNLVITGTSDFQGNISDSNSFLTFADDIDITGTGTSTAAGSLDLAADLEVDQIFGSGSGTSTLAGGWNISAGCFAVNGVCVGAGGGASEWNDGGNFLNPNEVNDSILIGSSDFSGINALLALRATSTTGSIIFASSTASFGGDFIQFVDSTGLELFSIDSAGVASTTNLVVENATATSTIAGGLTVDTNTLVVDFSTNRVGIGTTSPQQLLGVQGNVLISGDITSVANITATGTITNAVGSAASPSYTFSGDTNTGISAATADNVVISTAGISRWNIDSADMVFTVQSKGPVGSAGSPTYSFSGVTGAGISSPGGGTVSLSTAGLARMFIRNSGNVGIGAGASGADTTADADLEVSAGGATGGNIFLLSSDNDNDGDLLTVTEAGNVGIGTTTPLDLFNVYGGNVTFQTNVNSATAFRILNAATSSVFTIDTTNGNITLLAGADIVPASSGDLTLGSGSLTALIVSTDGTGNTEVQLPAQSIGAAEILNNTITATQIAADTINGTELVDAISLDANFSIEGADTHSITLGGGAGASITSLTVDTDGTGDGEVVLPAQSISGTEILNDTINGTELADTITLDANFVFAGGGTNSISLGTGGATITSLTVTTDGTGDGEVVLPAQSISGTEILNDTLDFIDFQDALDLDAATTLTFGANNFIYTLDSTGQFAIGTTSPFSTAVLTIEATSTNSIPLLLRGFDGQLIDLLRVQNAGGSNLVRITNVGDLAITTNFQVGGVDAITSGRIFQSVFGSAAAPSYTFSTAGEDDSDTGMFRAAADQIGFTTGGTERVRIDASGNVGIGTTSPYTKLSVVGEIVGAFFTSTTTATSTLSGGLDVLAINQTGTATSTFANGIQIAAGCFELADGTCAGAGGGSSEFTDGGNFLRPNEADDSLLLGSSDFAGINALLALRATSSGSTIIFASSTVSGGDFVQFVDSTGLELFSIDSAGAASTTNLVVENPTATSTFAGGMTIATSAGSVGIGSSTPGFTLGITGTLGVTGDATFENAPILVGFNCTGGNTLDADASGRIICGTDASGGGGSGNWVFNESGGFIDLATTSNLVGIGTSSPYAKLSIDSGAAATTTLAIRPFTSQTANIIDVYDTSATPVLTSVLTSANFLGIGTTSPTEQLSVGGLLYIGGTGTSTFENNLEALGDLAANQIFLGGATSTASNGWDITSGCFAINGACVGGGGGVFTDAGNFLHPNDTDNSLLLGSSDFAGINALLALRATSTGGTIIFASSTAAATGDFIQFVNSTGAEQFAIDPTGLITSVGTAGTSTFAGGLTIATSGGLVGIGTSSPAQKLTLYNGNFLQTEGDLTKIGGAAASNSAKGVYVSGKYAYVVSSDSASDLEIYDISEPTNPTLVGGVNMLTTVNGVHVSGKYAYIVLNTNSGDDLEIYDISNPTSPFKVGGAETGSSANDIYVSGRYAYVADTTSGAGFGIYDIYDPTNPTLVGSAPTNGSATDVYVSGRYAYEANVTSGASLEIFDVSDPASPVEVGSISGGGGSDAVYVSGRYAYIGHTSNTSLEIYDVSDPTSPTLSGAASTTAAINGLYVAGNYAYTANAGGSVDVIDVSDPANPFRVGGVAIDDTANGIFVSGKYAYVVSDFVGEDLEIFDIAGIDTPAANIGSLASNNISVWENLIVGSNAYIQNGINVGSGGILSQGAGIFTFSTTTITNAAQVLQGTIVDNNPSSIVDIANLIHSASSAASSGIGAGLLFSADDGDGGATTTARIAGILTDVATTSITSVLTFSTKNTAGSLTEYMRLDQNGNLGIGTTTPAYKLTVNSSNATDNLFQVATTTNQGIFVINSDGNVGIGVTSPVTALEINGALTVPATLVTANPSIRFGDASAAITGSNTSDQIDFITNGTGRFSITNAGIQVVRGTVTQPGIAILGDTNTGLFSPSLGSDILSITTGGIERARFDSTGNVGIGTTSPYAKLSVVGEIVGAFFTGTTTATSTLSGGLDVLAINQTGTATSTFANGIQISAGCFELADGTCAGAGGGVFTDAGNFLHPNDTDNSLLLGSSDFTGINALLALRATSTGGTIIFASSTLSFGGNFIQFVDSTGLEVFSIDSAGAASTTNLVVENPTATSTIAGGLTIATAGGSVGIATSTPAYTLGVGGTLGVTGDARFENAPILVGFNCTGGNTLDADSSGRIICGTDASGGGGSGNWVFNESGGFIDLATTSNIVGIGTSSPYAKLSIDSGAAATTTLALRPFASQTANIIDIYDTSATPVLTSVLTSANFLGIGTTSPSEQLSVGGLLYIGGSGTSTFTGGIKADVLDIISSTATSTFANGIQISAGCFAINAVCIEAGGSSEFTDGGNFLRPNEADDSLLLGSADFSGINALLALRATSTAGSIIFASSTASFGGDFLQFVDSAGTNLVTIDSSGYLGLGSSTPWGKLSVSGLSTDSNLLDPLFIVASTTSTGTTSTALIVTRTGNIGIGTSSPAGKLTLYNGTFLQTEGDPTHKGSITDDGTTELNGAFGIYVSGKYAYVASNADNGVEILDISDPTNPVSVGSIDDATCDAEVGGNGCELLGAIDIYVSGKYAYVTSLNDDGVEILDISDPTNPTHVGSIDDSTCDAEVGGNGCELNGARGIYVSGKYAYVTGFDDDGVEILDISDPTNPTHVGSITDAGATELNGAIDIYVSGKYAYVASFDDNGVEILDISDPTNPTHVGSITDAGATELSGAASIYVSGKYAYVASFGDDGVEILDISDPTNPTHAGSIQDTDCNPQCELDGAFGIYVSGKYAYVTGAIDNGVEILNIASSTNPTHAGSIDNTACDADVGGNGCELSTPRGIYVSGKYVYVAAEGDNGVEILDISGIDTPSANIGNLASNDISVWNNLTVANSGYFQNGLNVGPGGLFSQGGGYFTKFATTSLASLPALQGTLIDSNNSSIVDIANLIHMASSSAANGIGAGLLFSAEDEDGSATTTARIAGILTNVATTSIASVLTFSTKNTAGSLTEYMRIDENGNVGIGTTSPYAKLSVVGEIVAEFFTATSTTASSTAANGWDITDGCFAINAVCIGAGGGSSEFTDGGNFLRPNEADDSLLLGSTDFAGIDALFALRATSTGGTIIFASSTASFGGNFLRFVNDAGTEVFSIDSNGSFVVTDNTGTSTISGGLNVDSNTLVVDFSTSRVGIGTANPQGQLHIAGEGITTGIIQRSSSDASPAAFIIRRSRGTVASPSSLANGDNLGLIQFQGYNGTNFITGAEILAVVDAVPTGANMPGRLVFGTTLEGEQVITERMRITNAGNVGIGTTSPYAKLSVVGEVVAEFFTATGTATSTFAGNIDAAGDIEADQFFASGTGATSTFQGLTAVGLQSTNGLEVSGTTIFDAGAIQGSAISDDSLDFTEFQDALDLDAATTLTFGANNFIYTLDSTGQFAVGTTSPEATTVLTLEATSTASVPFTIRGFSGQTANLFQIQNAGSSNLVVIDSAANLGIGTTTPAAVLGVAGNVYLDSNLITFASSSAADLTIAYQVSATSTIPDNVVGAWNIATSTTANPIFTIDTTPGDTNTGRIGLGTTSPRAMLSIDRNSGFASVTPITAGIDEFFRFELSAGTQFGNTLYIQNAPTATNTLVGQIIRIEDNTTFGNTVRGLEVQADRGTNTKGENTGVSAIGRTFGVRAVTVGDAGGSFLPAGLFAQTQGTTQGNAIRAYSSSITSAQLVYLFHESSAFTGTGLRMNLGQDPGGGGSFTGDFLKLQIDAIDRFSVTSAGTTTIGETGQTANQAGLQIGFGGICVDNDGTCVASTSGRVTAQELLTGGSDIAETYLSDEALEAGDIVALSTTTSNTIRKSGKVYDKLAIGVISTKPGLLLGFDESPKPNQFPVALAGQVPVKISLDGGSVAIGDRITSSARPGIGMKATTTGTVIGIAIEPFTAVSPKDAAGVGKILVFMDLGWNHLDEAVSDGEVDSKASVDSESGQINLSGGVLNLEGKSIINVRNILSASGTWSISEDGTLVVKRLETEQVKITGKALSSAVILSGMERFGVENSLIKENSRIFISFRGNPRGAWWISEQRDGFFIISLNQRATDNLVFDYWIIDTDESQRTLEVSSETGSETQSPPADNTAASTTTDVSTADTTTDLTTATTSEISDTTTSTSTTESTTTETLSSDTSTEDTTTSTTTSSDTSSTDTTISDTTSDTSTSTSTDTTIQDPTTDTTTSDSASTDQTTIDTTTDNTTTETITTETSNTATSTTADTTTE